MSRRLRLVVIPALLLVTVAAVTFGLAQLHPAKPDEDAGTPVTIDVSASRDAARGAELFTENCASCHGPGGRGGGVGPALVGSDVSPAEARTTIQNGRGVMPPDLVSGQDLEDVLAYLETISS